MHDATRRALNCLNHRFYAGESAAAFSHTRSAPWPGWSRVLTQPLPGEPHPRVLDVGCGNGRFARAVAQRHPAAQYTGFDLSCALLEVARSGCPLQDARFLAGDLVEDGPDALPEGPFDLIVAWGLLHHIPGLDMRMDLLRSWTSRLLPGGVLAFSFWQPAPFRSERLALPAEAALGEADLEPGDHLVRWGTLGKATRYVHLADDPERAQLIHATGLDTRDRFAGDAGRGDQNDYVVLRRSPAPAGPKS